MKSVCELTEVAGRDCTSAAVNTKLVEPADFACGTISLRKQVGQSICVPLLAESHVMC
jgi:hypothetical protein